MCTFFHCKGAWKLCSKMKTKKKMNTFSVLFFTV